MPKRTPRRTKQLLFFDSLLFYHSVFFMDASLLEDQVLFEEEHFHVRSSNIPWGFFGKAREWQ
jgi:hypothetical protein